MRLIEITKPEDLTINQLYLVQPNYRTNIYKGYCREIKSGYANFETIKDSGFCNDYVSVRFTDIDNSHVWLYNATIYNKYQLLLKQQAQERDLLLNGKPVIVQEIANKKWYERFLRRTNK